MSDWARRIVEGDLRALARAATGLENREAEARALLRELPRREALVVGVTGPPGAGKSTLVDQLARVYRAQGKTVAVIAVDPSSTVSGGAILGDRIRMQQHHADNGIFIRSMATRGAHGGLADTTADLVDLFNRAGRDVVVIETVGVGQAEVDVARLASVTVLVLVPGMGDDVQTIKAGIMEIADIYVINKADHPGVEQVEREIQAMQSLGHRPDGWIPPIVRTVATDGAGVEELAKTIEGCPRQTHERRAGGISIDHLGVAVRSVDTALRFYEDQLGMRVSLRETVPHEQVQVAMLPAGGPRIELLEPTAADSVIGKFIEKRGEGLHHVALRVPDLAGAVERLKSAGARILDEPRKGAGGHEYVFVHPASTGGVLLELIQESEDMH